MEQQIKEAIEKVVNENLPQQTGVQFTKFFAKAEEDARQLQSIREQFKSLSDKYDDLRKKELRYLDLDAREAHLNTVKIDLQKREDALEITLLKQSLKASEARATEIHALVSNLVRNTDFRRDVYTTHTDKDYQVTSSSTNETVTKD